jgi:hypothetical protein
MDPLRTNWILVNGHLHLLNLPGAAPHAGDYVHFAGHTSGLAPAFPLLILQIMHQTSTKWKNVGLNKSLTQEQKDIALYWNDLGTGIGVTPPGHSISIIARDRHEGLSLGLAAMAYAKCGMSLWDGFIRSSAPSMNINYYGQQHI